MSTDKTPCEKLGYKVGDKFELLESVNGFDVGDAIRLRFDDGTNAPDFETEGVMGKHDPGFSVLLEWVKPVRAEVIPNLHPEQPNISHLTNEELYRQYRFDDNALIREFVERLSDMEDLENEIEELERENERLQITVYELERENERLQITVDELENE